MGPAKLLPHALAVRAAREDPTIRVGDLDLPIHDLFWAMEALQKDPNASMGGDLDPVREYCEAADKIFVCTHGSPTNTDHAFDGEKASGKPLGDSLDMARLLRRLLLKKDRVYNLALVMCYGARTDEYRPADLDHQGMIPPKLLATSFAYKVFKNLCGDHQRQMRMTARTQAVTFDTTTGASLSEPEVKVDIALELRDLMADAEVLKICNDWKAIFDTMKVDDIKSQTRVTALIEKFKDKPQARSDGSADQKAAKAYFQLLEKKYAITDKRERIDNLEKYGKIVYESLPDGKVRITNKYVLNPKVLDANGMPTSTVLYQGDYV